MKKKWFKSKVYSCCSCATEDVLLIKFPQENWKLKKEHPFHRHCEVCYTTLAGNACSYPTQYDRSTMQAMAQIANLILRKLNV